MLLQSTTMFGCVVGARNLSAMECRKGRRKGLLGGLLLAWLLTSSGRTVVARNIVREEKEDDDGGGMEDFTEAWNVAKRKSS
ncbi:hypothetical protein M0804_001864 [Polistes exclamans]|nr:hypothetical protein M0804_001864 [Polistes exclamans]